MASITLITPEETGKTIYDTIMETQGIDPAATKMYQALCVISGMGIWNIEEWHHFAYNLLCLAWFMSEHGLEKVPPELSECAPNIANATMDYIDILYRLEQGELPVLKNWVPI